jgi:predicted aldo/keto reductase-like oxidoreductase
MITRRAWLKTLAILSASQALPQLSATATAPERDKLGPLLPQRVLGKTGLKVSMLSVGGSHVGRPSEAEAEKIIEAAIELGVRTFETAQLYQNGGSEERYGKFLTPKYREHVLVFTKTMATDAKTAEEHLNGSLRRMKLDYVDLWQMHDIGSPADVDERLRNGVLDFMLKAKSSGKVRHIGFTGHTTWRAHAHLLAKTDVFETCLMPINVADVSYESFILNILPKLTERNMGVLAMKTLAAGDFLRGRNGAPPIIPERISIEEALRFVWSLPVSTLVSGLGLAAHARENIGYATRFDPLDETGRKALATKIEDIAKTGKLERNFKPAKEGA